MKVQTAEKDQMKYFAQNYQGKITVFYVQTAAWFSAAKKNKFIQVCGVLHKTFSPLRELQGSENITLWTTSTPNIIHHLNIRKQKPYKYFRILNIES